MGLCISRLPPEDAVYIWVGSSHFSRYNLERLSQVGHRLIYLDSYSKVYSGAWLWRLVESAKLIISFNHHKRSIALAILKKKIQFYPGKTLAFSYPNYQNGPKLSFLHQLPTWVVGHGCSSSHPSSAKDLPWISEAKKYNFNWLKVNVLKGHNLPLMTMPGLWGQCIGRVFF